MRGRQTPFFISAPGVTRDAEKTPPVRFGCQLRPLGAISEEAARAGYRPTKKDQGERTRFSSAQSGSPRVGRLEKDTGLPTKWCVC